jgi:glycosyltransferase involved in cell wall biosynthesis
VTVLIPCLNEAVSLPESLATAKRAMKRFEEMSLSSEILVADNGSTDGSVDIADANGCRVVHCPEKGYGNVLRCGLSAARGRFVVIGDGDGSYDFAESVPMVEKLLQGYDLCMGNRFKGRILPGAMPWKNKYIGNPALSAILNLFFSSGLGDAHSGLRAVTREACHKMKLTSPGMEFASEIVVKAALLNLKRTEVPITLHPDKRDRSPHLRPWRDGWRHLKLLLILSPLWLYVLPSLLFTFFSLGIFLALLATPPGRVFTLGPFWFGDHWMILAGGLFYLGFTGMLFGVLSFFYSVQQGFRPLSERVRRAYRFINVETTLILGILLLAAGLGVLIYVFISWSGAGFGPLAKTREMVLGTSLMTVGVQTTFGGFLLSSIVGQSLDAKS